MCSFYVRIPRLLEASVEGGYTRHRRPFITWRREGQHVELWIGTAYVSAYLFPPP